MTQGEQFHQFPAAARIGSVSVRTLERAVSRGELRAFKVGTSTRILHADLMAWLMATPVRPLEELRGRAIEAGAGTDPRRRWPAGADGRLPAVKVGGRLRRIRRADLEALLQPRPVTQPLPPSLSRRRACTAERAEGGIDDPPQT